MCACVSVCVHACVRACFPLHVCCWAHGVLESWDDDIWSFLGLLKFNFSLWHARKYTHITNTRTHMQAADVFVWTTLFSQLWNRHGPGPWLIIHLMLRHVWASDWSFVLAGWLMFHLTHRAQASLINSQSRLVFPEACLFYFCQVTADSWEVRWLTFYFKRLLIFIKKKITFSNTFEANFCSFKASNSNFQIQMVLLRSLFRPEATEWGEKILKKGRVESSCNRTANLTWHRAFPHSPDIECDGGCCFIDRWQQLSLTCL